MHPFHYCDVTVYGFHGCNKEVKKQILSGAVKFEHSVNKYDWLGAGVYFWENDFLRAQQWATEIHGDDAAVIGAKITLGQCFDLSNSFAKDLLRLSYNYLLKEWQKMNVATPVNKSHSKGKGNPADMILRYLDKIVIENAISLAHVFESNTVYDTVRAPFQEGFPVYPGSAFREHDHIHLCVRNPELLTELFDPETYY
ncbi:hypothetical protein [Dyadobacter luticola]|uniref:DUF3990 domain-containing protein n=1 Tax=Dyadobacter luticola TaxID=1979387 RepID=A0A5R9KSS0_9BACT|nr:hypothetical protein [Dyadobacter luticola]TLU99158.1 hypothetical protein FEN17_21520 [Dyadobacter luticola]